jgi:hypothetical protein
MSSAPAVPDKFAKGARQPVFWGAVAYALGIILSTHVHALPSRLIGAAFALIGAGFFFRRRMVFLAWPLALFALFVVGILNVDLKSPSSVPDNGLLAFAYGPEVEMTAHVTKEGRILKTQSGEIRQSLDVKSEEIAHQTVGGHAQAMGCA